jgi:putative membrane protein
MLKRFAALAAVVGVLLYAGAARSLAADEENRVSDPQFVWQASAAGLAEVNLSMLARDRAHSDDVKKFAQHMIDDHGKANKALIRIADSQRMRVAPSMDQKHETLAAQLARLSGKDFDRAYADAMLKDHEEAVSLFSQEAKHGQNKELKEFADKTLPTLKDHLSMARRLAGHDEKSSAGAGHEDRDRTGARTGETGSDRGTRDKGQTDKSDRDKSDQKNADRNKGGTTGSDKDKSRPDRQ